MDDLAMAWRLANLADRISLPSFRAADHSVKTKPDGSPVTESDTAVETAIRAELARKCPSDSILGEEQGYSPGTKGSGRRWIIDPIDGTKNFMSGIPLYGTLIALEVDGKVQVAVVSMPALGRGTRYWAVCGGGVHGGLGVVFGDGD